MPRRKLLSDFEKGQIVAMKQECLSVCEIARTLSRSPGAVHNFLNHPKRVDGRKSTRNATKISKKQTQLLLRDASKGEKSCRELKVSLEIDVGVRRIQQILRDAPHFKYKKMLLRPQMLQRHKSARLEWSKKMLENRNAFWRGVIFSDEKKFNLDGPDGLACYWHDLRRKEQVFSTRHQGESLMLWGAISCYGPSHLVRVDGNIDCTLYCEVLEEDRLPFAADTFGEEWTFQQNGASCHRSNYTKNWLSSKNVKWLGWLAKSPDLNIIEIVWGLLARRVYRHGRQFCNLKDLADRIIDCWSSSSEEYLNKLYESIPRRLVEVLEKKGGRTKY
ncbi:unnamed protein product [Chondrus crispus]|uniref:Tc3 transposase DNA binding domain-containing protein n=1 Tax=Chondrus crispus TaxID=2769 RepID=R7QCK3_CHOCR|nr:unnamed protein product [Chondrus crispus]CDF35190.1 unnamed protein product [Chondrus crispus]|eukprot:XP_005715009.1 unnamed protein product [Chondrus crispus]